MAWVNTNIEFDGVIYLGHRQDTIFTVPLASAMNVGDTFKAEGNTWEVLALEDLNNRGEVYVIDAKEVKYDKPKARRVRPKSGEPDV